MALAYTQGHKQEAARKLGWGRNTLTRKLRELGMDHGEEDEHWQDQEQAEEATRRP